MGQLKRWGGLSVKCVRCGFIKKIAVSHVDRYDIKGYRCRDCSQKIDASLPDSFDAGYVIGAVTGDGYLCRQRGRKTGLALEVSDSKFADRFCRHAVVCGKRPWRGLRIAKTKSNPSIGMPQCIVYRHRMVLASRDWYAKAEPIKGGDFSSVSLAGLNFRRGFLQGVIDAEGHQYSHSIDIANKNLELLELLSSIVLELYPAATVTIGRPRERSVRHLYIGKTDLVKTEDPGGNGNFRFGLR